MQHHAPPITKLPPGPKLPSLVQLLFWMVRPVPFMEECARRYGEVFTIRFFGFGDVVYLTSPAAIREVFTGDPDVLRAGEAGDILEPLVGQSSLLTLDGAEHLRQRKLLLPPFQGERMQAHFAAIHEATLRSFATWPRGRSFAIAPILQEITLRVILTSVFGLVDGPRQERLAAVIHKASEGSSSPFILFVPVLSRWIDLTRFDPFRSMLRELNGSLFAEIADRRLAPDAESRPDVLSRLLASRDDNGAPMTDLELRDELVTLLLAGHETTATTLSWILELLLSHPEVLQRVKDELLATTRGAPLAAEHVTQLDYLDATVRESMRLRPIIPVVMRRLSRPLEVAGYHLPAGAHVGPCIYLTQRRADLYPEPLCFRPERFLATRPDPYAWFPFGGGTRRCIGLHFALYEIKVVLATVLSLVTPRLCSRPTRTPRRRGLSLVPSQPVRIALPALTGP